MDADTERERLALAARTFVELAGTLVVDFDVHELMTLLVERCTTLLGADGVALMLLEADGVDVTFAIIDDMIHIWPTLGAGVVPEAQEAIDRIVKFVG